MSSLSSDSLTPQQIAQLLEAGRAEPLLPDHFPVPVLLDGRWWHLPSRAGDAVYEPAPPAVAALFARQHARLAAAGERTHPAGPAP